MEASSEYHMISITDDVINKVRFDLVYNGELDESVLHKLQATWQRKMIQAGIISGVHDSIPTHTLNLNLLPTMDESGLEIDAQFPKSDQYTVHQVIQPNPQTFQDLAIPMKKEYDEFFIPQQDGAIDGYIVTELNTDHARNDENEEVLNEDDDDEEDVIGDEDKNIPHLVMCQFEKVRRMKNKWDCKFKAGVMHINGKNILFSEAKGDFNF